MVGTAVLYTLHLQPVILVTIVRFRVKRQSISDFRSVQFALFASRFLFEILHFCRARYAALYAQVLLVLGAVELRRVVPSVS